MKTNNLESFEKFSDEELDKLEQTDVYGGGDKNVGPPAGYAWSAGGDYDKVNPK